MESKAPIVEKEQILQILREKPRLKNVAIRRELFASETEFSKRQMNHLLYEMQKDNLICRTEENPPLWAVI